MRPYKTGLIQESPHLTQKSQAFEPKLCPILFTISPHDNIAPCAHNEMSATENISLGFVVPERDSFVLNIMDMQKQ